MTKRTAHLVGSIGLGTVDEIFHVVGKTLGPYLRRIPDGVPGAEVMANANSNGGLELAKDYWVSFPEGYRAHQVRLEGGDCSTDSFCYPSV